MTRRGPHGPAPSRLHLILYRAYRAAWWLSGPEGIVATYLALAVLAVAFRPLAHDAVLLLHQWVDWFGIVPPHPDRPPWTPDRLDRATAFYVFLLTICVLYAADNLRKELGALLIALYGPRGRRR